MESCKFCHVAPDTVVLENEFTFSIRDGYPVTEGHSLIIPKRHVQDFFDLTIYEVEAIYDLLKAVRTDLLIQDSSIAGFNVGINSGEAAGQTIFHCHVHLIPRRKGDVHDPRGGVRKVIRGKGRYPFDSQ